MKRLLSTLAVGLTLLVLPGCVQEARAQVTTAPAIKVKDHSPKYEKFQGVVVNCTPVAITVRDAKDNNKVRTFTFDPALKGKMENRSMENGAKVTVKHKYHSDTAVALHGKMVDQGRPILGR